MATKTSKKQPVASKRPRPAKSNATPEKFIVYINGQERVVAPNLVPRIKAFLALTSSPNIEKMTWPEEV